MEQAVISTDRSTPPPAIGGWPAMSADGEHVLTLDGGVVRIAGGRALVDAATVVAIAALEHAFWLVTRDRAGHALHRFDVTGTPVGPATALGALGEDVVIDATRTGARVALIEGDRGVLVREREGVPAIEDLGERRRERRVLIGARGVAERVGQVVKLRTGAVPPLALPNDLRTCAIGTAAVILDGSALLLELVGHDVATALVYDLRRGDVCKRIRLGELRVYAVAERAGLVVLGRGTHLAMLDLRAGRCTGERILPTPAHGCAIDAGATRLVVVDATGVLRSLGPGMTDLDAPAAANPAATASATAPDHTAPVVAAAGAPDAAAPVADAVPAGAAIAARAPDDAAQVADTVPVGAAIAARAADDAAQVTDAVPAGAAIAARAPDDATRVAGAVAAHPVVDTRSGRSAEHSAAAHPPAFAPASALTCAAVSSIDATAATPTRPTAAPAAIAIARGPAPACEAAPDDVLALVAARPLRALGEAPADRPFTGEVLAAYLADAHAWIARTCATAIAIARGDAATIAQERAHERAAAEVFAGWNRRGAPHVEVARDLGLSPLATTILMFVAAPQIWGELARAYGACTADPARPLVDELLLAHLLEADVVMRTAIGGELDDARPLVRSGAILVEPGVRPYAALRAHPAIARRLAGVLPAHAADVTALVDVVGPRDAITALAGRLAEPRSAPVRVVVRGRRGMGRRTLGAALARQAGRALVVVDGRDVETLQTRLREVALRGQLPCLDLDEVADDPAIRARLRAIADEHGGPLLVRAPRDGELPLGGGADVIELPALSETTRRAVWQARLQAHALDVTLADALAPRFPIGPGTIARACAAAATAPGDRERALIAALRAARSSRIALVADRVDALAAWDQLVVPADIGEALHELVARVRHRRTVLEAWGLERVAATARGVTALFQGGPGTGKTMAAGVVARALGYELWRIDLSKVMSKWIGETEKNLAAVFDAAEDGEVVLLFDEADSLFTRRTDVKSSNDKHANAATNYLLQRLDAFTGVAILTTNFGTAIDPAFKRRLSVQVEFPFPDEDERERLWRAHLPPSVPTRGDLDLAELARRYQLSGGYIRNAVLRAAYLAADRDGAISADHLRRAVLLEKERAGKLGDGRLE